MELIGITIAECSKFIQTKERGGIYFPRLFQLLNDRYGFMRFPTQLEDMNFVKGITLSHGQYKSTIAIQTLMLQDNAIMASGQANTEEIENFIDDVMEVFTEHFGFIFEKPSHSHYLSRLEFKSTVDLLPKTEFQFISDRLNTSQELEGGHIGDFSPTGFQLHCELLDASTLRPYSFNIIQKSDFSPSGDIYVSDAPLKTDNHFELLKSYEDHCKSR